MQRTSCPGAIAVCPRSSLRSMGGPRLSPFRWAVAPVGFLIFAAPSRSATTSFNDNFNRVDANGLGANWVPISGGQLRVNGSQAELNFGTNTMYALTGHTAAYTHTTLKVDVSNAQGPNTGFQTVALCIAQATSPSSEGLFLQVSTTDATGLFNRVEMDTGVNMNDPSKWTTPSNIFSPTPFASARITASAIDVDTIRVGIDTDFNGTDEEFFTRDLNLGAMSFGNRMGLTINGAAMRADNFNASIILPANVLWNVANSGTWNSTSNNWLGGSLHPNRYFNTDHATFGSTAGGTITLASGGAGMAPGMTTVTAASGTYTFVGEGILTGTLTKQNFGRLVLANPNTFTGITTVSNSGGTVSNDSGAHLTLNNPSGNALSGDLHIGVASAAGGTVAKVNLAQSNQIADNRVVYFDSSAGNWAYWSLRGNSETIAGIVSTNTGGAIENGNLNGAVNTNGTLTLAPPVSTTHSFSGIIRDADVGGGTGKLNIAVNGAGTQVLGSGGTYTYTGTTTVNTGTLRLQTNLTTSSAVNVTGGTLELASGASNSRVIVTPSITISGAGKLDLNDNKLITSSPLGSWNGSSYTDISGLVDTGRGEASNAAWDGVGIVTSDTRAVNNNDLVSIGTASASDLKGIASTATATFAGQTVLGSDTITMVTWGGDANLDGKINIDDYGQIDFNVGSSGSVFGWYNGDFNYDGKINIDDYGIIDFNVTAQNSVFSSAGSLGGLGGVAAVPEPGSIGMTLTALGLSLPRASRRKKS